MKLIFVSHATADRQQADLLVKQIEEAGISCWIASRDVPFGSNYAEVIVDAIEDAELVLLLLSPDANASPHVANEIERAVNYRRPIIPVRLADVKPSRSIELHVSTRQWVEMWGPMEDRQLQTHRLIERLSETLRDHLPGVVSSSVSGPAVSSPASQPEVSGDLIESEHTELEVVGHDGTSVLLTTPAIKYPSGFGPSNTTEGIAVRRGVEESVLLWSRVRAIRFRSRQEKNEKGTTVWRHAIEASLVSGRIIEGELQDDWNMAYMGGGGTGLLWGQTDLGEVKIPFNSVSTLKILKYGRGKS